MNIAAMVAGILVCWGVAGSLFGQKPAPVKTPSPAKTSLQSFERFYNGNAHVQVLEMGFKRVGKNAGMFSYSVNVEAFLSVPAKIEIYGVSEGHILPLSSSIFPKGTGNFIFQTLAASRQQDWFVRVVQDNRIVGIAYSSSQYQQIASEPEVLERVMRH